MGRNGLKLYEGKTLEQWQQAIRDNCDGDVQRRCKQNETTAQLAVKIRRNFDCYKARIAVQKFFDGVDQQHQGEIDKVWKTIMDCLRFFQYAVNGVLKRARKEKNRRANEVALNKNKRPKPTSPGVIKPKVHPDSMVAGDEIDPESLSDRELSDLELEMSRHLIEAGGYRQLH